MAAHISQVLARFQRDPFFDLPIADDLKQLLAEHKVAWRDRLLPPLVTLRLFLIQIVHGNCAITALPHLCGFAFAASSYCQARVRLPLQLLQSLMQRMNELVEQSASIVMSSGAQLARRILVVDGTNYSTPDTPELARHFHLPRPSRAGVGYPTGKLMGLLNAVTGMFQSLLGLPLFDHDMRGGIGLHPMLRGGDILLGDRAFCSFAHFALLQARGVLACMRLHQARKNQSHGPQRWNKPKERPVWMEAQQYLLLPDFIDVRVVEHKVTQKGFRSRRVLIATTLMDQVIWPDAKVAQLYGYRWQIETCFGYLKTTMKMNVLHCQTLDGVMKELAMYLIVYNMIRLVMLSAAARQKVAVQRISFIDAMRQVAARMIGLAQVEKLIVNPDRTGRTQLRVIRRRSKEYDWLLVPRREKEAQIRRKEAGIA